MHGRIINLDTNTEFARRALHNKFTRRGIRVWDIRFGAIRKDSTRGVKFKYGEGQVGSYSYLTDII